MGRPLSEEEAAGIEFNRRGVYPRYPWAEWSDGRIWELIPGEDFQCSVESFRSLVSDRARKQNMVASVNNRDNKVYLQFITKEHS
jgi:hypothetical protein